MENNNTQLPAEVVAEIKAKAKEYAAELTFNAGWVDSGKIAELRTTAAEDWEAGATEYATKLHLINKAYKELDAENKDNYKRQKDARALLEKFISRHEAGLLPDRFIYQEIKNFLDGTQH